VRLIALVCGPKPEGSTRRTLRLLAEQWTTLAHTETKTVSYQIIRRTLKKRNENVQETAMVYPAGRERRVCSGDGGYLSRIHP
jgi:hypothetical protein